MKKKKKIKVAKLIWIKCSFNAELLCILCTRNYFPEWIGSTNQQL